MANARIKTTWTHKSGSHVYSMVLGPVQDNGSQLVRVKVSGKTFGFLIQALGKSPTASARRNRVITGLKEELARQAFREYASDTGTYKVQSIDGMQWEIYQDADCNWCAYCANDDCEYELEEFEPTKSIDDCVVLEDMIHDHLRSEGQL